MTEPIAEPQINEAEEATMALAARDSLRTLAITTPAQIAVAGEILVDVKGRLKALEERLAEITKPLNAGIKSARDLFRPAMEAYAEAEAILKKKIGDAERAIQEANRAAQREAQERLAQGQVREAALAVNTIVETPKVEGVRTQEVLTYEVTDVSLVPRELMVVDDKKVRAHIAIHGESPIPGIAIKKETRVIAARGR
jgi:hypothetical protein